MKRWIPHILSVLVFVLFGAQHALASVSTDNMLGYWKFDEGTGTVAGDSSGHSVTGSLAGGMSSTGWVAAVPGDISFTDPFALEFDGVDDKVGFSSEQTANFQFGANQDFTVSAWEKTLVPVANTYPSIVGIESANTRIGFTLGVDMNSGLVFFTSRTSCCPAASSTTDVSDGTWHHLLGVRKSGTISVYVDGTLEGTLTGANVSFAGSFPLTIGSDPNQYWPFRGVIDDVRIYNRALTGSDITALAAGEYTTAIWTNNSRNAFSGGYGDQSWETAANWDISAVPDPWTNIIIRDVGGTNRDPQLAASVSGASLTIESNAVLDLHGYNMELTGSGGLSGGGTLKLRNSETLERFSNIHTSSTGTVLYYGTGTYTTLKAGSNYHNFSINDGLTTYLKFDEGAGTTAYDASGYGRNGTLVNGPAWSTTTPSNMAFSDPYALDFDGTDDYVDLGMYDIPTYEQKNYTISTWIKTSSSTNGHVLHRGDVGNCAYNPDISTTEVRENGCSGVNNMTYSGVTDGEWHNVLVTRSNSLFAVYLDGTLANSMSLTALTDGVNVFAQAYDHFVIGARVSGNSASTSGLTSTYFDGLIDEVRVYNRPLSGAEISRLASGAQPQTASGTYTLGAALNVDGDLILAAGNLNTSPSSYRITVSGSWLNYGGTFTAQSGSVVMDGQGVGNTILLGGQSFHQLQLNDGLLAYWKVDETSGTQFKDSSGNARHASITGSPSLAQDPAPTNFSNLGSAHFPGVSTCASPGYLVPRTLSVSMWVTMDDYDLSHGGAASYNIFASTNYLSRDATIQVPFSNGFKLVASGVSDSSVFPIDQWVHVVWTYDESGGVSKLYKNGTLIDSATGVSYPAGYFIFGSYYCYYGWPGNVDDVRLYGRVLTADDVTELAAGDQPTIVSATYTLASSLEVTGGLTLASGTLDASSNNYRISASGGWMNYGGVFTARSSTVVLDGIRDTVQSNGSSFYNLTVSGGLIGYWTFDEGTGTTTKDLSGNGNTGTLNGGMSATGWTTTTPGTVNFTDPYALEFDGTDDYISLHSSPMLNAQQITLSAWVKPTAVDNYFNIFDNESRSPWYGYLFRINNSGVLQTEGYFGGSNRDIDGATLLTTNMWVHAATTYDGTTVKVYLNGVLDGSGTYAGGIDYTIAVDPVIGGRYSGDSQFFPGVIDDVRIYNRALTPAEIATLAAGNYASHSTVINDATTVSNSFINPAGLNLDVSSYTLTASNTFTNLGSITEFTGYVIHDATLDISDASIPGSVGFTLTDSDENTDSSTRETFTLAAQSENVTMTETTVNSGIFTGSLTTACGEETPNNGIVERQGSATYSFFATFTDPQDSTDVVEDSSTLTQTTCSVSTAPTGGGGGGGGGGGSKSPTLPFTAAKITTAQSSSSPSPDPDCSPLNTFSDVPSCSWYSGYVVKANNAGMVSGYANDDGTPKNLFGPADPVTYAQIAKMTLTLRESLFGPLPAETSAKAGGPGPGNPSAKNTWSAPYIAEAEALGLSQYPKTLDVNAPMPRDAVIRTLLDILGISPDPDSIHNPFTDLPPSHPHYGAILTAYEMGLISGDTDANGAMTGTVRPDDTISRSEAVKLLSLLLDQQIALPHADGPAGAQQEQTPLLSPSPSTGIYRMTQPLLYLRSTPSPKAYIIIVLRRNELLKVLSHDSGSPWAKVERSDGREGYVYTTSLEYVSEDWPPHEVRYTSNSLTNLRGGAFIDAAVRATLPKGTKVTVLRHVDVWSQVQLDDGRTGYIATELLEMNNE